MLYATFFALRQTFMAHPKSLAIVGQNLDRGASTIAENYEPAAERIHLQLRLAHSRQTLDTGTKIDARHGHEDPHLRGELNQAARQPDRHNCNTTSAAAPGAISSCSRCPFVPCSDNRQPLELTGNAPVNSMNFTAL
jgi:hypothetical protein